MYERYWNLSCKPFDDVLDPQLFFPSDSHQGALLKLRYCVEQSHSAALLSGAAGTGKSLLVSQLLHCLEDSVGPRVVVHYPLMPADELVAYLATELVPRFEPGGLASQVQAIRNFLEENARRGQHTLLVIDEAHLILDPASWEVLRLLLNFRANGRNALTLLLVGQPRLLASLAHHPGLDERMVVKSVLRPFNGEECARYVEHRLEVAGGSRGIFSPDALDVLHSVSGGIPRRIDRIAELALLVGFAEEMDEIGPQQIRNVADELVLLADATAA